MSEVTKFTVFHKQGLIEFNGLIYKPVWRIDRYESCWDHWSYNYRTNTLPERDIRMEFVWIPPPHLGSGEIRTVGLQPAIDLGFLQLVAPVKG